MLIYVPVIAPNYLDLEWKSDKEMTWWTEKSIFKYDYLMLSYGIFTSDRKHSDRVNIAKAIDKFFEFRKGIKLFYDSGGWQVLTRNMDINPISLAEVQKSSHSYVAFILDVPPIRQYQKKVDEYHFNRCLEKTKDNIEKAYRYYDDFDGKLYGVLHGLTEKQFEQWYNGAIEPYEF